MKRTHHVVFALALAFFLLSQPSSLPASQPPRLHASPASSLPQFLREVMQEEADVGHEANGL